MVILMRHLFFVGVIFILINAGSAEALVLDIKANGSDGPVSLAADDALSITLSLDADTHPGVDANWFLAAKTPFGLYHLNANTGDWGPDLSVTYQGPLLSLPVTQVFRITGLPTGSYVFYFGIDTNMNGRVDPYQLSFDSVSVAIFDRDISNVWKPMPGTSWQLQLNGPVDTSFDVQMYDIDLFDTDQDVIDRLHNSGRIVICYLSAGSWENWRPDAGQFPESVKGNTLEEWPDEKWLDIRQIDILGPLVEARLDLAIQKGCDGVDPDNVDAYTNATGFPLTAEDQIRFNVWLANEAHERNLSVGLKNDLDQVQELLPYFDWALNEQCFQYEECHLLLPFVQAGKAVFGVEYELMPQEFCPQANAMNFDWLKKNYDLDATRQSCR